MDLEHLLHGAVDVVLARRLGVVSLNGECTTGDGEAGRVAIELRELLGVHGGGSDDEFQIATRRQDWTDVISEARWGE